MKYRMICFGLAALVSMTSGCFYRHHPCFGFRLHPCQTGGGQCAPVCSSPIRTPIVHHRPPMSTPGCPSCFSAGPIISQPGGYPSTAYPPVIGYPVPIPGATSGPSASELHMPNPMPGKPGGS